MEAKQYTLKQPLDGRGNQKEILKQALRQIKIKV